jgi:hypothetical protein
MQLPAGDAIRDSSLMRREQTGIHLPRIVIVGTGLVGSTTTAYASLLSGMAVEIVVVGRDSATDTSAEWQSRWITIEGSNLCKKRRKLYFWFS